MRRRLWVLVITVVIATLVASTYLGWRFTRANEKLKQVLLEKIEPFSEPGSNIGKVQVNLSSLRLDEVRIVPKNRAFILEIDGVEIGYRLWNVLKHGFEPEDLAHEVMLIHPRLIVPHLSGNPANSPIEAEWESFERLIRKLEAVDLTVLNAEVVFRDTSGVITSIGNHLNGWVQTEPIESANFQLSGNLFQSQTKNLHLAGNLNLKLLKLNQLDLRVDPSEAPSDLPYVLPGFIDVRRGEISGFCRYDSSQGFHGQFDINDADFGFKKAPLSFDGVQFHALVIGNQLKINGKVSSFNGAGLNYEGQIQNILTPRLKLHIRSDRFNVSRFIGNLIPDMATLIQGAGYLSLDAFGAMNNLKVTGFFKSPELKLAGIPFSDYSARFTLIDSVLTVLSQGGDSAEYVLQVNGQAEFQKTDMPFKFQTSLDGDILSILPESNRIFAQSLFARLHGEIRGGLQAVSGHLEGGLDLTTKFGQLRLFPALTYQNKVLSLEVYSDHLLHGILSMNRPFEKERTWKAMLSDAQEALKPVLSPDWSEWISGLSWHATFEGREKRWTGWLRGMMMNSVQVLTCQLHSELKQSEQYIDVSGLIKTDGNDPVRLTVKGRSNRQGFFCDQFQLADYISAKGIQYFYNRQKKSRFRLDFDEFPIAWLHSRFYHLREYQGRLTGSLTVENFRNDPHYLLDLKLNQGQFHGIGLFQASLAALWGEYEIEAFSCELMRNEEIWLSGSMVSDNQNLVSGGIEFPLVDVSAWLTAFSGKNFVSGFGSGSVQIAGSASAPILQGNVSLDLGKIGVFPYQAIGVGFVDTLFINNIKSSGAFHVMDGRIRNISGTDIFFEGVIPWLDQREMDISIMAEGNLIQPFIFNQPFFKEGECKGRADLRIGGRPGAIILGAGNIQIDHGRLVLADFVDKIKEISLKAEIDSVNRFVHLSECTGTIEGSSFRVWNSLNSGTGLPLISESLDLNWGYIHIETDEKGMSVHIPGLMEEQDHGRIVFKGNSPDSYFTICGGEDSGPMLSGTLALKDLRLTYPFLSEDGISESSGIVRFLKHVYWDLMVQPLSDVHYVRSVESALGNVYADLQLKKETGSLYIQGVLDQDQFQVWGQLESTEGTIEALDLYFRPERITFDYPLGTEYPIVNGRAFATLIDTLGMPSTIWLNLTTVDDVTGVETMGGSWENIVFRFSTDNPNLARSEADLLAALGYSSAQIKDRAYDALGMQMENMIIRPIVRPIERSLRRHLGLDMVRVSSKFSSNLIQMQSVDQIEFDPRWLFKRTRLMLGKYLAPGLFITYSGQIQSALHFQYHDEGLGFRHALSLEYTFRPDLFLEMEYTYDSKLLHDRREDKRIWLKHVFPL